MRISDWSSDVCSSDLPLRGAFGVQHSESQFSAVGEEAFLPESETRNTALFLMETLAAGPVRLELAARQEWQRIETTLNREISHKPFSVSGAAIWDIGGDYSLALSLARSQRAPNVQELYRSAKRREGKEGVRTVKTRWSP